MKILFETKFGSHVYGTNTPLSDLDFKGIYQAEYRDIILNKAEMNVIRMFIFHLKFQQV